MVRVPEPLEARRVLDDAYEPDDDGWIELHRISDDERIVRAQLTLDGDTLTVSTQSEPRVERVRERLQASIPDLEVVSDEREPLRAGEAPSFGGSGSSAEPEPLDPATRAKITSSRSRPSNSDMR